SMISGFTNHLPKGAEHLLPPSFTTPQAVIPVDGFVVREVMRQHVPLAAGAIDVKDRVDDFTQVHFNATAACLRLGHENLDDVPLFVREIRRIGLTWHACFPAN